LHHPGDRAEELRHADRRVVVGEDDAVGGKERLDRIAGDRHPEIRLF
jgi:hypothetical protein